MGLCPITGARTFRENRISVSFRLHMNTRTHSIFMPRHRAAASAGLLAASLLAGGCAGDGASGGRGPDADELRAVLAPGAQGSPEGGGPDYLRDASGWTIVLAAFTGPAARANAEAAAAQFGALGGLAGARAEHRSTGSTVIYGKYPSLDDRGAARDLARIRAIEVQGRRPFARAFMAPPRTAPAGGIPQFNLSNARDAYGSGLLYTLQVAVYESPDRREAMRSAEQAASQLRQEGEQAFYYHGPTRSMVTIGVFSPRDYDLQTGAMTAELVELRRRRPHNLYNGMGIRQSGPLGSGMQSSELVQVP